MDNIPLQNLFDSVCRCFGQIPGNGQQAPTASGLDIQASGSVVEEGMRVAESLNGKSNQPVIEASHSQVGKRRTNRLGLKDQQWDELFGDGKNSSSSKKPPKKKSTAATSGASALGTDLGTAQVLAQAKLAANPPRYGGPNSTRTKRKRSSKTREEIFRNIDAANKASTSKKAGPTTGPTPFSRLIHPSLAMCFATPVREAEEEVDETDMRSVDNSDANTLNTCEDTVTSTVYYENKLAHMTETRPPMPLFNQFKIGSSKDEIRNIVATDSHSSINLIELMQRQHKESGPSPKLDGLPARTKLLTQTVGQKQEPGAQQVPESHIPGGKGPAHSQFPIDEEMEDAVPGVKVVSDSSGSDGSMQHQQKQQKRQHVQQKQVEGRSKSDAVRRKS